MLFGVFRSPVAVQANMNVAIMRAFVAMRNYVLNQAASSAELAQFWGRVLSLEQAVRDHSEAISDLSEDTRKDTDTLYEAIGACPSRYRLFVSREPIGYKK